MASIRLTGYRVSGWLAVAGLLLAGAAGCTGSRDRDQPSPPPSATAPTTAAPTSFASPPDGGALAVAETGFSSTPDDTVSYGVVVENTSSAAAIDSAVSVWLVDGDGDRIDAPTGDGPWLSTRLARLLPGERMGLGATGSLSGAEVADLEVEIGAPAEWVYPLDAGNWLLQPVVARDVTTERTADGTSLVFTVDASFSSAMVPGGIGPSGTYTAIFRDAGGTVIGGADCCAEPAGSTVVVSPGRSVGELRLDVDPPARADDARTEVYVLVG